MKTTPHKCSCFILVHSSKVAVTPSLSAHANVIIFSCKFCDELSKIDHPSLFRDGNFKPDAIKLNNARVSAFSTNVNGNPFETCIRKKRVSNFGKSLLDIG